MQTPPLPIQVSSPGASANGSTRAPRANTDGGNQFSQALSRQVEQRQVEQQQVEQRQAQQQQVSQQLVNQQQPKPQQVKPQQNEQPDSTPAQAKPATPAGQADDAPAGIADKAASAQPATPSATAADGKDKDDAGPSEEYADNAATAAAAPVADMLALVASFNRLLQGGAATVQETPAAGAAPVAAAAQAGGPALAGADAALAGASDAPGAGHGTAFQLPTADRSGGDGKLATAKGGEPKPGLGADTPSLPNVATDVAPKVKPNVTPEAAVLAATRTQERALDPALLKETGPATVIAPLQQAAAGIAQAVGGATGERISARVGTPAWDNQVGQKIVWMVAGKEQSAELTLNPPDLGPMQVVLSVTNDQASVTFSSAQPEVRQALENALPRLREMMGESGIALGNATVNAGASDQRQAQGEQPHPHSSVARADTNGSATDAAARNAARPSRSGELRGLVDTFA
jgi:flagellar hook-length control protein FliK